MAGLHPAFSHNPAMHTAISCCIISLFVSGWQAAQPPSVQLNKWAADEKVVTQSEDVGTHSTLHAWTCEFRNCVCVQISLMDKLYRMTQYKKISPKAD